MAKFFMLYFKYVCVHRHDRSNYLYLVFINFGIVEI